MLSVRASDRRKSAKKRLRTPSWSGRIPVISALQARDVARKLIGLGFTEAEVESLTRADAFRLCSWVERDRLGFIWMGVAAGVLYGLSFGVRALLNRSAGSGVLALVVAFAAFFAFGIGGAVASDWLQGVLDRYFWFGRAGGDLVRAVRRTDGSTLWRKESAIRAARNWHRFGGRRGLDVEEGAKRVFTMLGEGPISRTSQDEVSGVVRASLLDAIDGKVKPLNYEMPRAFAFATTATAGQSAAVFAQALGLLAAVAGLLAPILGLLDSP
jgi:hypothetical protein